MKNKHDDAAVAKRKKMLLDKTASYCRAHLDQEYEELCARLIEKMAERERVPFLSGDINVWAAGIVYALAEINLLLDHPLVTFDHQRGIAKFFGLRAKVANEKGLAIIDQMGLDDADSEFVTQGALSRAKYLDEFDADLEPRPYTPHLTYVTSFAPDRPLEPGEFVDQAHPVMMEYAQFIMELADVDLIAAIDTDVSVTGKLRELIERDPDCYATYLLLSELLEDLGDDAAAEQIVHEAYNRAALRLTAETGEWPRRLQWGWPSNRHILQTLAHRGRLAWEQRDTEKALEIFRRMLAMDPEDALTIRAHILAIHMNVPLEQFRDEWPVGPDGLRLDIWFEQNAPRFPDEFSSWLENRPAAGDGDD